MFHTRMFGEDGTESRNEHATFMSCGEISQRWLLHRVTQPTIDY